MNMNDLNPSDRAVLRESEAAVRDRALAPKERPILFSGPMVRALLAGTKTQTRRPVKGMALEWLRPEGFTPTFVADPANHLCPYGAPGDRLWVREAWRAMAEHDASRPLDIPWRAPVVYEASRHPDTLFGKLRPGMFMPRWASRITLEIVGVRVERLHDISEADARAEGIVPFRDGHGWHTEEGRHYAGSAIDAYLNLWTDINGEESAKANPFVWCIEFRKAASGCSHTARSDDQSKVDDQEPTAGSSHV